LTYSEQFFYDFDFNAFKLLEYIKENHDEQSIEFFRRTFDEYIPFNSDLISQKMLENFKVKITLKNNF
jgi:hypothetical protein